MGILDMFAGRKFQPEPKLQGARQLTGRLSDLVYKTVEGMDRRNKLIADLLDNPDSKEGYQAAMEMIGLAPLGLTVWHGSPHKFDKFDMSKIGTGEGAQAYGHGLYVAENKATGISYRDGLSTRNLPDKTASQVEDWAKWVAGKVDDETQVVGEVKALIDQSKSTTEIPKGFASWDEFQSAVEKRAAGMFGGSLYKVDIPDEAVARMLDWDKPLSQQAPEVQKAIEGSPYAMRDMAMMITGNTDPLGGELVKTVMKPDEFANYLRQQGIPGIRYLDGGSRSAGQGSSNFVLFDENLARIIERNGQATGNVPWSPGEWQDLLAP